jgi:hypothetical protein
MKAYLKLSIACVLFSVTMMAFVMQEPQQEPIQDEEKKVKPLQLPASSKSDDIVENLNALKKELADERRKNDSVNTVRQSNLNRTEKSLVDLRKANEQYRKSLSRLRFILEKFPPDSVMKYYGEYTEPDTSTVGDSKKKTEHAQVTAPVKKRSFFQRLFKRNK